jgi:hypothetical protein
MSYSPPPGYKGPGAVKHGANPRRPVVHPLRVASARAQKASGDRLAGAARAHAAKVAKSVKPNVTQSKDTVRTTPAIKPGYGGNPAKIKADLDGILSRSKKRFGKTPKLSAIRATYRRNLERRARSGIIARSTTKYGKAPLKSAVNATYQRHAVDPVRSAAAKARKYTRDRKGQFA